MSIRAARWRMRSWSAAPPGAPTPRSSTCACPASRRVPRAAWCYRVETIAAPADIAALGGVQYLYVEGGAQTAAAFLAADLVDRLELYRAPILIGGGGTSALGAIGLSSLDHAHGRWRFAERRQLGSDAFEAYERARTGSERCSPA